MKRVKIGYLDTWDSSGFGLSSALYAYFMEMVLQAHGYGYSNT